VGELLLLYVMYLLLLLCVKRGAHEAMPSGSSVRM